VHLVFVIKYRRSVLTGEHLSRMEAVCLGVAEKMGFQLLELVMVPGSQLPPLQPRGVAHRAALPAAAA
jgi:response regulator RpfG family c-di-GMP phosphodiesterase